MKDARIAIIGAGLTGLVAGYRLSQEGKKVTIFEKSDDIGGLMGGFKIGGTSLEKAYHHIFSTDTYIIELSKELGLFDNLKWHEEKTALYFDGTVYPFMGAADLLKFKPLDIVSKIRLGLVKIWLQYDNDWQKYENVLATEWMKKWCGQRAYEVIWKPLLKGKFHDRYEDVSMAWLWARIHTRGNSSKLGYFEGGFKTIADELAKRIKDNGSEIKLNTEYNPSKSPFNKGDFEKVVYTGASKEIGYLGAVCVVFTSKQSLSPFYWHNINDTKSPFLCFIQHTNLIDKKVYGGKHVYYLGTYVPNAGGLMDKTESQIKSEFFNYLRTIYPKFIDAEKTWVFKFKNAQHIVTINYKVPKSKINKNIYQANFAQIYPEDRGTNFAVREGEKIAKLILKNV